MVQDADLVQRAAEGDLDAFTVLVESRRERVFWIACHVVGDFELARDVVQEVFLRLFRVIRRFRKGGRFDAWLYRITLHLAIDAARRERPHRQTAPLGDLAEESEPRGPAAADGVREREVRRIFADLAARLGPKQRAAFVLREIEGMSTGEVAAVLGTTESTVRNHILQARRLLKDGLASRFPEYAPKKRPR